MTVQSLAVPAILTQVSPLLAAMEDNLHGHIAFVQRQQPGMTVDDCSDLLLVDSGLPTDTYNKIARARLREDDADRRIGEAVGHFRRAGRPFAWVVGPGARPLDLEQRLPQHGLRAAECDVGMAMELADLPLQVDIPAGLEIRRVGTVSELADFGDVSAANWDPPDRAVSAFYQGASQILLRQDCPMRLFVGYLQGLAVAASELFLGGGVAGLYGVATRTQFRRRGIGSALTWAAADEARRLGIPTATLQASEDGQGVYARLGFQNCCHFAEFQ